MATTDDPIVSREQWEPEFRGYRDIVLNRSPGFDPKWLQANDPSLNYEIRLAEDRIDGLDNVPLSKVMELVGEWRKLILEAELKRKEARKKAQERALSRSQSSPEHEGGRLKERVESTGIDRMIMIAPTKGPGEADEGMELISPWFQASIIDLGLTSEEREKTLFDLRANPKYQTPPTREEIVIREKGIELNSHLPDHEERKAALARLKKALGY